MPRRAALRRRRRDPWPRPRKGPHGPTRHPRGQCRGRELVVGDQDQRRAQRTRAGQGWPGGRPAGSTAARRSRRRGPPRRATVSRPGRATVGRPGTRPGRRVTRPGPRAGQALDHARDHVPACGHHRRAIELEPERVGRGHRRDDHLQPLQQQRARRQRRLRRLAQPPPRPAAVARPETARAETARPGTGRPTATRRHPQSCAGRPDP